ncbi:MAG: DEAD/DEAH box helicase family protein [Chloroflexi bacterium]|nr:DEAD/DEAH box helicase family protein [Chloroflexota bacterium]
MLNEFYPHEDDFLNWVRSGYPGAKSATLDYIQHLSDPEDDSMPREGTLWEHQWDCFLRVVYGYEIAKETITEPNGVLLNVVTGGGKTAIIAALMVWLRLAHDVYKFLLLCPNLIVRDRLEDDFEHGKVFVDRDLIPKGAFVSKDDFGLTTLGSDRAGGWATLLGANVILGNIHQFYASNTVGQSNLTSLLNGTRFALFNDEAHNSPAPEWDATLAKLRPHTILRVDTTATPDRADGQTPDSRMICEYEIRDALADRLVKTPVVYQPSIATVELTYTDARTGETRAVEEIDWAEVDRLGINATQWVTDDKPMQQQMAIALQRLKEQERRAKGRYQPILFVVAVCKLDAEKAAKTLNDFFKVKTLLVTEDSSNEERRQATELGRAQRGRQPYKAVVSVLMLREGWDVPEVGVILLLRKFGSRVYGQQVIGRGLRRVRKPDVALEEQQICAVVDHPKLEHQWLWEIFNSRVREHVGMDDMFDEDEDLPEPPPRQQLVNPGNLIDLPEPSGDDDGSFVIDPVDGPADPRKDWQSVLEGLDYPTETVIITDQSIVGVERRELTGAGWMTLESAPVSEGDVSVDITPEALADAVKEEMLQMSERLLNHAGHSSQFKGLIYDILLRHVRSSFLEGASLGLAESHHLEAAWRMLPQVEKQIKGVPGLVEGMVKYANK